MSARLLFISDLHLQESRPDISAALMRFLADNHGRCESLYILGDLFEVWLGDDAGNSLTEQVAAALQAMADSGTRVYLMHGNRDFLIGEDYARACGARLLADPTVIDTPIGPVLLSHGDALCTDDVEYQAFRAQVRDPAWQQAFLARSVPERIAFASQAREQSRQATATKTDAIMDVNQAAVSELMSRFHQTRLLHGHTHRPAQHALKIPGQQQPGWRLVLGDWDRLGWFGEITASGVALHNFALQPDS